MRRIKLILKAPKSFAIRLFKLSKIFGFWESIRSLSKLFKKPLDPKSVIASAYCSSISRKIYFRPATDDVGILEQVFIDKDYDYDFTFTPEFLIDGGAHCGYASLYLSNKFPDMRIVAIEPEPENFSILRKNLSQDEKVNLINNAITEKPKKVELSNPQSETASFRFEQSEKGKKSLTIESLIHEYKNNSESLMLKLDIEGAEKGIFTYKPKNWIKEFDLILVEPHDWIYPNTERTIIETAKKYNKKVEKIGENLVLS
jgi:FkbM family methyltransferase